MAERTDPSLGEGFVPVNPYALARSEAAAQQIRRFYTEVTIAPADDAVAVLLDGRPARTPKRRPILLPSEAAAGLVAAEFAAQDTVMKPGDMAVLRLVNAVLDGVADSGEAVRADVMRFVSADMLFYRADGPDELVRRQADAWDPVLAWARDRLQATFSLSTGIMHVMQPDAAVASYARGVAAAVGEDAGAPFRLGALHLMTTLTGSALLALAVLAGDLPPEDAWRKAHIDEDFQISRWGRDEEAATRRARRWSEMRGAADLLEALRPQPPSHEVEGGKRE